MKKNQRWDKWKNIPCSWIGRINIVEITKLPKVLYRFHVIPSEVPMAFFIEVEQKSQNLYENTKVPK